MRAHASSRQIGVVGTAARIVIGLLLLVLGALGGRVILHDLRFDVAALVVGLVIYPAIFFVALWLRSLRSPGDLKATGVAETAVNWVLIVALTGTAAITPISYIGFGVMVYYGATMLLAAALGYGGCEVTTVSNWVLRRHDQVGCPVLSPIDALDHRPQVGTTAN